MQPANLRRNVDGKLVDTRSWDKYRQGKRMPRDGCRPDGSNYALRAAESSVPESGEVFRHPLWRILKTEGASYAATAQALFELRPFVRRYFFDLSLPGPDEQMATFGFFIGRPVLISPDDNTIDTFDHLYAHLMMLRILDYHHSRKALRVIARNIVVALGYLSRTPWLNAKHAEALFDLMERRCWGKLLDEYYHPELVSRSGWRKAFPRYGSVHPS